MPNYFDDPNFKPNPQPPPALTFYAIVSFACLPVSFIAMILFVRMEAPSGGGLYGVPGAGAVVFLGLIGLALAANFAGMAAAQFDGSKHPFTRLAWWLNFAAMTGIFALLAWLSKT